jgi:hypothetical protein
MIALWLSRMHSRVPPAEARRSDVCGCRLLASRRLGILPTLPAGAAWPATLAIVIEVYDIPTVRFSDVDPLVHILVNITATTSGGAMLFEARPVTRNRTREQYEFTRIPFVTKCQAVVSNDQASSFERFTMSSAHDSLPCAVLCAGQREGGWR